MSCAHVHTKVNPGHRPAEASEWADDLCAVFAADERVVGASSGPGEAYEDGPAVFEVGAALGDAATGGHQAASRCS